jgi:predicted DNA binding protein
VQIVNLLVHHECPFSRPVEATEGVRVTHLCHRGKETMLEVHAREPEVLTRLVSEYERIGGEVLYQEPDRSAALVRFAHCACCGSGKVIPIIEGLGHLYLPPSGYAAEGESYQFLAQEKRLESYLPDRLPPGVMVARVGTKPLTSLDFEGGFLVPVGVLFRGLTDRQREAVVAAILRGYYRIPHAVTTEELARGFGISRPAFDGLLRKAENKLAAALFPYLTVQGSRAAKPSRSLTPRSVEPGQVDGRSRGARGAASKSTTPFVGKPTEPV